MPTTKSKTTTGELEPRPEESKREVGGVRGRGLRGARRRRRRGRVTGGGRRVWEGRRKKGERAQAQEVHSNCSPLRGPTGWGGGGGDRGRDLHTPIEHTQTGPSAAARSVGDEASTLAAAPLRDQGDVEPATQVAGEEGGAPAAPPPASLPLAGFSQRDPPFYFQGNPDSPPRGRLRRTRHRARRRGLPVVCTSWPPPTSRGAGRRGSPKSMSYRRSRAPTPRCWMKCDVTPPVV